MGKCTTCGKPDIGDTGLCAKYGGKVVPKTMTYGFCLNPEIGWVDVNNAFSDRAGETLYQRAISNFMGKGPSGASKAYSVNGVMVSHDTCGKGTGNHASVFFRWAGNKMNVYALGYHPGGRFEKVRVDVVRRDGIEMDEILTGLSFFGDNGKVSSKDG